MRVESAKPCKSGGWFHRNLATTLDAGARAHLEPSRRQGINAHALMRSWSAATTTDMICELGARLGIDPEPLADIGVAWAHEHAAWAFPMQDGYWNITGIRLRDWHGRKWSVTGSRQGIFRGTGTGKTVYICEGPTDTAAAKSLGLFAIGRPSCNGCFTEIEAAIKHSDARCAVIISDNDVPGLRGAEELLTRLKTGGCIWTPPAKDMREFATLGGTKELVETLTSQLCWRPAMPGLAARPPGVGGRQCQVLPPAHLDYWRPANNHDG